MKEGQLGCRNIRKVHGASGAENRFGHMNKEDDDGSGLLEGCPGTPGKQTDYLSSSLHR